MWMIEFKEERENDKEENIEEKDWEGNVEVIVPS